MSSSLRRYTLPEVDTLWDGLWSSGAGAGAGLAGLAGALAELNLSSLSLDGALGSLGALAALPTSAVLEARWPRGEDGARVCGAEACPIGVDWEDASRPRTLAHCEC